MLVAALSSITVSAQSNTGSPAKRPSLVLGIVVEGLSTDYIDLLKSQFGSGGFRRLLEHGVTISDVDFGTPLDGAAATAMIFTGASPSVNGIGSAGIYDPETRRVRSVFLDPETIGNFTDETLSPRNLTASTIADELRIDAGGLGYAYAIAPEAAEAIIMAGHAGTTTPANGLQQPSTRISLPLPRTPTTALPTNTALTHSSGYRPYLWKGFLISRHTKNCIRSGILSRAPKPTVSKHTRTLRPSIPTLPPWLPIISKCSP